MIPGLDFQRTPGDLRLSEYEGTALAKGHHHEADSPEPAAAGRRDRHHGNGGADPGKVKPPSLRYEKSEAHEVNLNRAVGEVLNRPVAVTHWNEKNTLCLPIWGRHRAAGLR